MIKISYLILLLVVILSLFLDIECSKKRKEKKRDRECKIWKNPWKCFKRNHKHDHNRDNNKRNHDGRSICDNAEAFYPCTCVQNKKLFNIECLGNTHFHVKEHFQKLSQIPEIKDTIFTNLIMNNPQITHIPEGGFGDISFQSIHFKNVNLERIHLKAFTASVKTAVILKIDSTKLQNEPRPYSVYDLANSFQNLIILSIGHEFDLLFEEGFNGNLTGLRDLSVKVNELEGSPFYEMSNLQNLIISDGKLSHLTLEAFKIGNRIDDQYLSIKFVNIKTLNGSSFESGTFVNAQGPVSLSFDSCHVNYLHETVFGAFLDAHPGNTIESMASEPIDCSDCRTYWIFGRKSELQDRMNEVYCNGDSSGGDIWTSEDKFAHCKDWVGK